VTGYDSTSIVDEDRIAKPEPLNALGNLGGSVFWSGYGRCRCRVECFDRKHFYPQANVEVWGVARRIAEVATTRSKVIWRETRGGVSGGCEYDCGGSGVNPKPP
jgi:hypothetical protein